MIEHGKIADGPLVTVIIPSYNHKQYIEHSIRSVINQTYNNIQLVVIDDGSKDGSAAWLTELSAQLNFDFISQENRGVCRTLNRAIKELAKGEYIALLGSDDFWHAEKITRQIEALQLSPPAEFCFSQAIEFEDENHPERGRIFPRRPLEGDVLQNVFLRQHVPAGSMLFSRQLYDRIGGFDENLKEEDWDFVIRCAAVTPFVSVKIPLLYYRSHPTNIMRTRDRALIFQQKAMILSKNFRLVSPWWWLTTLCVHFVHDIIFARLIKARSR